MKQNSDNLQAIGVQTTTLQAVKEELEGLSTEAQQSFKQDQKIEQFEKAARSKSRAEHESTAQQKNSKTLAGTQIDKFRVFSEIDKLVELRCKINAVKIALKEKDVKNDIKRIKSGNFDPIYQDSLLTSLPDAIKAYLDEKQYEAGIKELEATPTFKGRGIFDRMLKAIGFRREQNEDFINRFAYAVMQYHRGESEACLRQLKAILAKGFLHQDVYCLRSKVYCERGESVFAERDCILSLYAGMGRSEMFYNYATFLMKHMEVLLAKVLYKETIIRKPEFVPAYIYLSIIQRYEIIARLKRYSEGMQEQYSYNILAQMRVLNYATRGCWVINTSNRLAIKSVLENFEGKRLAIFGAGNCNNYDVNQLSKKFKTIRLIDYDKYALAYARRIQDLKSCDNVLFNFGIDITGIMRDLYFWNVRYPEKEEVQAVINKAREFVVEIEHKAEVVLMDCVLSDILFYVDSKLTKEHPLFKSLIDTVLSSVYRNLFNRVAAGGTIIVISEVMSSETCRALVNPELAEGQGILENIAAHQSMMLPGLNLYQHKAFVEQSALYKDRVQSVEVSKPWVWFYPGIHYLNAALIIQLKS